MSAFSAQDFNALRYSSVRPAYPNSFYKILSDYHQGPRELVVDVGCGPGVATFQLSEQLNSFQKVIGTDLSSTMIESARSLQSQDPQRYSRVSFEQSPGESFEFLKNGSDDLKCDMVTAVECVHWFDFAKFQEAVAAILRPGGTLAIWGYGDFFFEDYPLLTGEIDKLSYSPDGFGSYWEQPGRRLACEMLKELHYDPKYFRDIEEVYFYEDDLKGKGPDDIPLFMHQKTSLAQLKEYIKSWSGYHSWKKNNPNAAKDITDTFVDRAMELYPQLNEDSVLQITWRTFWMFARRD